MPVAVEMKFKGGTLEQYDKVIELMELSPAGAGAPGGLFHWVSKTDEGILVVDVWETKEQYEKFAGEKIGPFAAQAGIAGPPEVRYHDVHNYFTAG
jgi:hypothetical protein